MENLFQNLKIKVSDGLFQTDPINSKLGKNIVYNSIELIVELGFEKFNFKKLSEVIGSPEASIYRYFKSKNQLLTYLISMYWGAMEYLLVFNINNISSPEKRLEKSIFLITSKVDKNLNIEGISINKLHQVILFESVKSFLTKDVDIINQEGAFQNYKQFVERISNIIKEINPQYKYPHMLLTTIIEGYHLQVFFAEHLPRLTNKQKSTDYITKFYTKLALQSIKGNS